MHPARFPFHALAISTLLAIVVPSWSQTPPLPSAAEDISPEKAAKLAGLYYKLNQNADCRTTLDRLLAKSPGHTAGLVLLGKLELREKRPEAAVKAATQALQSSPDDMDATVLKAYALLAQGKESEATKLLARVPPSELDSRSSDYQIAEPATLSPDSPTPGPLVKDANDLLDDKLNLVRFALSSNNLSQADKLSKAALAESPGNLQATSVRAEVLVRRGRPAEAVKILQEAKAAHPKSSGPFPAELDLASAQVEAGQTAEALRAFKAIANDARFSAEDREQARKALTEDRRSQLVTAIETALDKGRKGDAQRLIDEAITLCPQCPEVRALHARVLDSTGQSSAAVVKLEEIKAALPAGAKFDHQVAYAQALRNDQQYRKSAAEFTSVIHDSAFSEQDQMDARDQLEDLQRNDLAGGEAELLSGKFEEGSLMRVTSQFATHRFARTRYLTRFIWDNVDLSDTLYPRSLSKDVFTATAGIDHRFDPNWSGNLHLGGYRNGAMGNGGVVYQDAKGQSLGLDLAWDAPARDTLLLTAMDGRQKSITVSADVPLGSHFAWTSSALARKVEVNGTQIGDGYGLDSQFRWHPFKRERDIYVAYALELKQFNHDFTAFERESRAFFGVPSGWVPHCDEAIPERINRHALQLHGSVPLWPKLLAAGTTEVAWREEADQTEFGAIAELIWKINDHASINARLEYYSGGAGPNAGEDVILGALGSRWTW